MQSLESETSWNGHTIEAPLLELHLAFSGEEAGRTSPDRARQRDSKPREAFQTTGYSSLCWAFTGVKLEGLYEATCLELQHSLRRERELRKPVGWQASEAKFPEELSARMPSGKCEHDHQEHEVCGGVYLEYKRACNLCTAYCACCIALWLQNLLHV